MPDPLSRPLSEPSGRRPPGMRRTPSRPPFLPIAVISWLRNGQKRIDRCLQKPKHIELIVETPLLPELGISRISNMFVFQRRPLHAKEECRNAQRTAGGATMLAKIATTVRAAWVRRATSMFSSTSHARRVPTSERPVPSSRPADHSTRCVSM